MKQKLLFLFILSIIILFIILSYLHYISANEMSKWMQNTRDGVHASDIEIRKASQQCVDFYNEQFFITRYALKSMFINGEIPMTQYGTTLKTAVNKYMKSKNNIPAFMGSWSHNRIKDINAIMKTDIKKGCIMMDIVTNWCDDVRNIIIKKINLKTTSDKAAWDTFQLINTLNLHQLRKKDKKLPWGSHDFHTTFYLLQNQPLSLELPIDALFNNVETAQMIIDTSTNNQSNTMNKQNERQKRCYTCGSAFHLSPQCPENPKKNRGYRGRGRGRGGYRGKGGYRGRNQSRGYNKDYDSRGYYNNRNDDRNDHSYDTRDTYRDRNRDRYNDRRSRSRSPRPTHKQSQKKTKTHTRKQSQNNESNSVTCSWYLTQKCYAGPKGDWCQVGIHRCPYCHNIGAHWPNNCPKKADQAVNAGDNG